MISIYCLRTLLALWLSGKSACLVNKEIPGSNPGSASFSNHTLVYYYDYQVLFVKMISSYCPGLYELTWRCGLAVKAPV